MRPRSSWPLVKLARKSARETCRVSLLTFMDYEASWRVASSCSRF